MSESPQSTRSEALDRLAAELSRLGAETRAERAAKQYLPWVFSIAIHIAVGVVAVFITWTVANLPQDEEAVLIVADFNAMMYDPVAAPAETSEQTPVAPATAAVDLSIPAPSADQLLLQIDQSATIAESLLADAGSSGAAAALANIAPAGDSAAASFAGTSATNARRIVYLIDATGSMIAHLQIVVDELQRSLMNLSPQQSFAVIFFQGDQVIEVPPAGRLTAAGPREPQRVVSWIKDNIVPRDKTNPIPAIERSLRHKPDVIFLLSHGLTGHGEFEIDQHDLLAMLDERNPMDADTGRRVTQINCIQFIANDPLDTMRLIAEQHGGPNGYKFLSREELGITGNLGGP